MLDASEIGSAVYVIKTTSRSAYDAAELIGIGLARFHDVSAERVHHARAKWRRSAMDVMDAKLRVRELYEAQEQVGVFGVEQARSLVLSLDSEGVPASSPISAGAVAHALSRVLPEEEARVVLSFLQSTAAIARGGGAMRHEHADADATQLERSHVGVGVAVLCDGAVDARLRLCFDAFDADGSGALDSAHLVGLLGAIYRTYYKSPPPEAEVRAAAEVMFLTIGQGSPTRRANSAATAVDGGAEGVSGAPSVGASAFVMLASAQPTLVQCFATRGTQPLLTPRAIDKRARGLPAETASALEALVPFVMSPLNLACTARDGKAPRRRPVHPPSLSELQPSARRGPLRDDKRLAAAARDTRAVPEGGVVMTAIGASVNGVVGSVHLACRTLLSGTTEVLGGVGGALDGALNAMDVPMKRNPLGEKVATAHCAPPGARWLAAPAARARVHVCLAAHARLRVRWRRS